jgi:hypothetical protein
MPWVCITGTGDEAGAGVLRHSEFPQAETQAQHDNEFNNTYLSKKKN